MSARRMRAAHREEAMINRRYLLGSAGAGLAVTAGGLLPRPLSSLASAQGQKGPSLPEALPEGTRAQAVLDALPGKKPLIKLSYRPPNYETPIEHLRTGLTPNDAFFVRYHLADVPKVDANTWRLAIGGEGASGQAA